MAVSASRRAAAVITMFGLAMIVQTLVTAGVLQIRL